MCLSPPFLPSPFPREREARHVLVEGTWEFIYNTWEDEIRHHVSDSDTLIHQITEK
jgi:hypothetical protein